jgi:hypothetical protein
MSLLWIKTENTMSPADNKPHNSNAHVDFAKKFIAPNFTLALLDRQTKQSLHLLGAETCVILMLYIIINWSQKSSIVWSQTAFKNKKSHFSGRSHRELSFHCKCLIKEMIINIAL